MQRTTGARQYIDGGIDGGRLAGWPNGVDSFSHPLYMRETQVRWMENASTSGGFIQTRPGFKTRMIIREQQAFTFFPQWEYPCLSWWDSVGNPVIHPQMIVAFQPTDSAPQIVFAVSGSIFFCEINTDGSLKTPRYIATLQFNPVAAQLTGVSTTQTATIVSGQYANNILPKNLLIIQDGVNRAGIWDGKIGYHANPEKKVTTDVDGNTFFTDGYNETRIGLWTAWSGNRLWIANGNQVFASDLGDPLHFTEEMVLNSGQVFTFPEEVTGMADRGTSGTSKSQVFVFTRTSTYALWSGVQNRIPSQYGAGWAYTSDFVTKLFSGVGCVAGKSIVIHRGLIYWRSEDGIVLFDSSGTVYSTQNLPAIDQEMAYSKRRISPDCSTICAGYRDSMVFWSVPTGYCINGRVYPTQTQVLDRQTTVVRSVGQDGPFSFGTTGWQGVWTGIRPVEWATIDVNGASKTYALSIDSAGVVQIWEAFQGNRCDNGKPIPWMVETRAHKAPGSLFETSIIRNFRLKLDQLMGNTAIEGYWRGTRGTYKQLLNASITATPGSVFTPIPGLYPITNSTSYESFALQSRVVISENNMGANETCQDAGVESPFHDGRDTAFSLLLKFTGRAALVGYRIGIDVTTDNTEGVADGKPTGISENGFNIVPEASCPYHVDGTTPTYTLPDAPASLAFVPFVSTFDENQTEYECPPIYQLPS